jgi:hypothetical protein
MTPKYLNNEDDAEDENGTYLDIYPDIDDPEERGAIWAHWSSKEGKNSRPVLVQDMAEKANLDAKKDVHDHYGYRVAYMMFKFKSSYEELMEDEDLQTYFETSGKSKRK